MSMSSDIDFSPADVLIIGAGASGATAAWNLAETKMRIVCLEQGGGLTLQTTQLLGETGRVGRNRISVLILIAASSLVITL